MLNLDATQGAMVFETDNDASIGVLASDHAL